MNRVMSLANDVECDAASMGCYTSGEETQLLSYLNEIRWTTKQVISACLWSALFGVGCGYAWVLLQIGTVGCR